MQAHHPDDVALRGAERHPHADLARALRHEPGDHAVDSERRQHEARCCEQRHQQRVEARLRHDSTQSFFHRPDSEDRQRAVECFHRAADRRCHRGDVVAAGQDHQRSAGPRPCDIGNLHQRQIEFRSRRFRGAARLDVADDPDDRLPMRSSGLAFATADALADRVLVAESRTRQRFVDDHHERRLPDVGVGERSPGLERVVDHREVAGRHEVREALDQVGLAFDEQPVRSAAGHDGSG